MASRCWEFIRLLKIPSLFPLWLFPKLSSGKSHYETAETASSSKSPLQLVISQQLELHKQYISALKKQHGLNKKRSLGALFKYWCKPLICLLRAQQTCPSTQIMWVPQLERICPCQMFSNQNKISQMSSDCSDQLFHAEGKVFFLPWYSEW